jgi:hypothetical protein
VFGTLDPEEAETVILEGTALGIIFNDDFCPRTPKWWESRSAIWPTNSLEIGGVLYEQEALAAVLDYRGRDASTTLAREVIAGSFNLLVGSDPAIHLNVKFQTTLVTRRPRRLQFRHRLHHE